MCGTVEIIIPQGSNFAKAAVETPFEPKGCVACPNGAMPNYTTSTQVYGGGIEVVMFRSGSTASSVTRSASYVAWG